MSKKIKTIFVGTPDFGVPSFKSLLDDDRFEILFSVTQPDKKAGRGNQLSIPPIKQQALKKGIKVLQPLKISEINSEIKQADPDLIVVIAYAGMIPRDILDIPKFGVVNVHGSLLPKYRGSSCIQAAILNGDNKTGITIMKMDEKLDHGSIISKHEIDIGKNETTGTLFNKLSKLGEKHLVNSLIQYINRDIHPSEQDHSKANIVKNISKNDGLVDWGKDANYIERFIRAMHPWPGSFSFLDNDKDTIKINKANNEIIELNKYKPGTIFTIDKRLYIQCGENSLEIIEIQPQNKKSLDAKSFINGYKNLIGKTLK